MLGVRAVLCNTWYMSFLSFLLLVFAAYWLTRFVTVGKFPLVAIPREAFNERWGTYADEKRVSEAVRPRSWVVRGWLYIFGGQYKPIAAYERDADGLHPDAGSLRTNLVMKSLAYLWECDWCTGAWVAAAVVALQDFYGSVPMPGWAWLAIAGLVGLLRTLEPGD